MERAERFDAWPPGAAELYGQADRGIFSKSKAFDLYLKPFPLMTL
jgi:hypothetical protein